MADLPVRLVYVIGMPSGGTSCAADILYENGFWSPVKKHGHESNQSYSAIYSRTKSAGIFDLPEGAHDRYSIEQAEQVFWGFKQTAQKYGYDKAVMKAPGLPIWCHQIFYLSLIKVEPLLVWREPKENAASIKKRFPNQKYPEYLAYRGQTQIEILHKEYGWPMWRFGKNANENELAELLGIELKVSVFDRSKVTA